MSFDKTGTPNKIQKVAANNEEFEILRKKIAEENILFRCVNCNKLLSKKSSDNKMIDLQHKHLSIIVSEPKEMKIQCPGCNQVNTVS